MKLTQLESTSIWPELHHSSQLLSNFTYNSHNHDDDRSDLHDSPRTYTCDLHSACRAAPPRSVRHSRWALQKGLERLSRRKIYFMASPMFSLYLRATRHTSLGFHIKSNRC